MGRFHDESYEMKKDQGEQNYKLPIQPKIEEQQSTSKQCHQVRLADAHEYNDFESTLNDNNNQIREFDDFYNNFGEIQSQDYGHNISFGEINCPSPYYSQSHQQQQFSRQQQFQMIQSSEPSQEQQQQQQQQYLNQLKLESQQQFPEEQEQILIQPIHSFQQLSHQIQLGVQSEQSRGQYQKQSLEQINSSISTQSEILSKQSQQQQQDQEEEEEEGKQEIQDLQESNSNKKNSKDGNLLQRNSKLKNFFKNTMNAVNNYLNFKYDKQKPYINFLNQYCDKKNQKSFFLLFPNLQQKIKQNNPIQLLSSENNESIKSLAQEQEDLMSEDEILILQNIRNVVKNIFGKKLYHLIRLYKSHGSYSNQEELYYGCIFFSERQTLPGHQCDKYIPPNQIFQDKPSDLEFRLQQLQQQQQQQQQYQQQQLQQQQHHIQQQQANLQLQQNQFQFMDLQEQQNIFEQTNMMNQMNQGLFQQQNYPSLWQQNNFQNTLPQIPPQIPLVNANPTYQNVSPLLINNRSPYFEQQQQQQQQQSHLYQHNYQYQPFQPEFFLNDFNSNLMD